MKLIFKLFLISMFAIILTGCSSSEESTTEAETETESSSEELENNESGLVMDDLAVVVDGLTVKVDDDVTEVLELLGDGYEYYEAVSCAYDGMDKTYTYNGGEVIITTLPIDGKDVVCEFYMTTDAYATAAGVKVGQTKADIEAAYGTGYTYENGQLTYWLGTVDDPKTPRLSFTLDENEVITSISIYSAKNSG